MGGVVDVGRHTSKGRISHHVALNGSLGMGQGLVDDLLSGETSLQGL
jgi:hypothetical protein